MTGAYERRDLLCSSPVSPGSTGLTGLTGHSVFCGRGQTRDEGGAGRASEVCERA